jgi:hypothetical protein
MAFTDAEIKALKAGAPRRGIFMRLDTDPVVRAWLGVGNIKPGVNALDPIDGAVYRGFGEILDMPAFQQLCDGSAERLSFSISGIAPTLFADIAPLMSEQQAAIAGKSISCGYALLGYDWQPLGPVRWSWDGTADYLRAVRPVVESAEAPETWTIELSAGSFLTQRKRPGLAYFTQPDQAARSAVINPGATEVDKFCERTPLYSADTDKTWPTFAS